MNKQKNDAVNIELSALRGMIRLARLSKGLSQEQLAEKCGTTKAVINKIETAAENAKIDLLRNIIENGLGGRMEISVLV
jgi:transcriptional regulator with XRE-family HTH domain